MNKPASSFWKHASVIEGAPSDQFRIPSIHSRTPIENIAISDAYHIHVKREDQQPGGSHKIRAACFQVSRALENGDSAVVIPSSGNAAIAVALVCRKTPITPIVFLSPRTHPGKIDAVCKEEPVVIMTPKPINHARYAARIFKLPNLRPSLDPDAVKGFMTLGYEIYEQQSDDLPDAVFIFSTSGASLLGIGRAFTDLHRRKHIDIIPQLHCVQTEPNASIARQFESRKNIVSSQKFAGWGGAPRSNLTPELVFMIRETGGSGWIASDEEIIETGELLKTHHIHTSHEGAAAVSAAGRFLEQNRGSRVLVILTGREYGRRQYPGSSIIHHQKSYKDIRELLQKVLKNA